MLLDCITEDNIEVYNNTCEDCMYYQRTLLDDKPPVYFGFNNRNFFTCNGIYFSTCNGICSITNTTVQSFTCICKEFKNKEIKDVQ